MKKLPNDWPFQAVRPVAPSLAIDVTLMAFNATAAAAVTIATEAEADKRGGFFIASGLFAAAAAAKKRGKCDSSNQSVPHSAPAPATSRQTWNV